MQSLVFIAIVTLAFGLISYQIRGELGVFALAQLVVGTAALLMAAALGLRGWGRVRRTLRLPTVTRALLGVSLVIATCVFAERLASQSGIRFDLTMEGVYEIAPATREVVASLPEPLRMTVYYDPGDPRIRRTRILLEQIAKYGDITLDSRRIEDSPADEDRFGIGSSNAVVLEMGSRWALVERPTEGALFESLSSLASRGQATLYVTAGSGDGDINRSDDGGFSGFAVALQTEGYRVKVLPTAAMSQIPDDADAVVMIRPSRQLRQDARAALDRYLAAGGGLVAFLDPGVESGLEALLAGWGMRSEDAILVDPTSGAVDGEVPGLSVVAVNYSDHPANRGLHSNRSTLFRRARAFQLHKPQPEDDLRPLVFGSGDSWLLGEPLAPGTRSLPEKPPDARADYYPIGVSGRFARGEGQGDGNDEAEGETRIVAFGDADFISNRYLRSLYNLDLVMNSVAWVLDREERITIRPKSGGLIQFPVPVQDSLQAFYGVGLLVPQLLLIAGGLVWLRQRSR